MKCCQVIIVL